MALTSNAAMVLFYDIAGDTSDHDDWHSYQHFHERLSVPGFLRATRWITDGDGPRYLVTYEVTDVGMATSPDYLARLNNPTPWTEDMMPRFRGMIRGFCQVAASSGFGLGAFSVALRFQPETGAEEKLADWLSGSVIPVMASRRGIVAAHFLRPAPPPPMTTEQALRGQDSPMPWLVIASAYDRDALDRAVAAHLPDHALTGNGASGEIRRDMYALHYTATAQEVSRTEALPDPGPAARILPGPRLTA